jgi:hypothetical protein
VEELLMGGRPGRAVAVSGALFTVGQSGCDLTFPAEPGLAGRHCEISFKGGQAVLKDVSGGLGTFLRLATPERELQPGDRVRVGNEVLAVEVAS